MSDDEHLSFAVLAVCDALEQKDDTKAREALNKARRHAHAVINRNHKRSEEELPQTCVCPADERPDCNCASVCRCDFEK